jgi:hypothetical protein
MKIMKDTTVMAYSLREFFACQIDRSRLEYVDSALFAGEPVDAMLNAFALAYDLKLYVPQEIRDEYLSGVKWKSEERAEIQGYLSVIPLERAA